MRRADVVDDTQTESITAEVIASFDTATDKRFRELMQTLVNVLTPDQPPSPSSRDIA